MGIKEVGDNLFKAERLLYIPGGKTLDTASGQANAAMADLNEAGDLLQRNKDIRNEADQRTRHVLDKLKEVQLELDALSELFGEGSSNGKRIQEAGQSATSHTHDAISKVTESKQLVESVDALDRNLSSNFDTTSHHLGAAKEGSQIIAEVGERHERHYTAALQTHEELSNAIKQARTHLTPLRGQVFELGAPQVTEDRNIPIENVVETVEWSVLPAIGGTAIQISARRGQLNS